MTSARLALLALSLAVSLPGQPPGRRGGPPPSQAEPPPVKPEERCALEGQVINLSTGEPVGRASLVLRKVDGRGEAPASTTTDSAGKFAMKDVEPGRYRLFVSRNGFVQQEYGATRPGRPGATLSLEKSQKLGGLLFKLIPHGVVSGRVTDDEGEPMARVSMGVLRPGYMNGRRRWVQAGFAETNDLGEYRIFGLAPGRYYLSATYRGGMMMMGTVDRSVNGSEETFVPAYYPGVYDTSSAQPLEVTAGGHLRGIDLTLRRTPTVRVRGRVANAGGGSRRGIQLFLVPRGSVAMMFPNTFGRTLDQQGNFEIRGVAPGSYILAADYIDDGKRLSARLPLDVGGASVENLVLTLSPGVELKGRLRADGQQADADLRDVVVNLELHEALPMGGGSGAQVREDGTFAISGLSPDHYSLRVAGLPAGFYVKSARLGDADALAGIDLSQAAAGSLDILISPAGAKLDGLVTGDNQQPLPGVTVILAPDESRRNQTHLFQNATTDQTGRYSFKGVAPGDYLLLAFDEMEPGAERDPEVVRQFERSAEKISLKENSSETRTLKVIPAASPN